MRTGRKKTATAKGGVKVSFDKSTGPTGPSEGTLRRETLEDIGLKEKMPSREEMKLGQAEGLLRRASIEIKALRAVNQQMATRARGWDEALALFNNEPARKGGADCCASPDLAHSIDRFLNVDF